MLHFEIKIFINIKLYIWYNILNKSININNNYNNYNNINKNYK